MEDRLAKLRKASEFAEANKDSEFHISDWRRYFKSKSRIWAYNRNTGMVKPCKSIEEAEKWLGSRNRILEYQTEEGIEQVLRSMS